MNDKTMLRETKARLANTGIGVHEIEFCSTALPASEQADLGRKLGVSRVDSQLKAPTTLLADSWMQSIVDEAQ